MKLHKVTINIYKNGDSNIKFDTIKTRKCMKGFIAHYHDHDEVVKYFLTLPEMLNFIKSYI